MALTIPNTFSAGTPITAASHNANNTAIANYINGNIDQTSFTTLTGKVTWSVSTNVLAAEITNSGTEGSLKVTHSGVLASGKYAAQVLSSGAQTTGDALLGLELSNASSSIPLVELKHEGTGNILEATKGGNSRFTVDNDGFIAAGYPQLSAGQCLNLALFPGTTTNANDSVRLLTGNNVALSDATPAYVAAPGTVSGQSEIFKVTSQVTIDLTGAHWGLGTNGDFTDIILRVYAINDGGTLKWGVSNKGGLLSITTSDSSATATDIDEQQKMLVTSTLSGTSPCAEIGWFRADFDDTGGAAEDLWLLSTNQGALIVGRPAPSKTNWTSFTPTGEFSTNTTYTGQYKVDGDELEVRVRMQFAGSPGNANPLTINLPSGFKIDTGKIASTVQNLTLGTAIAHDNGTATYTCHVGTSGDSAVRFTVDERNTSNDQIDSQTSVSQSIPYISGIVSGDEFYASFRVPVLGHSH